MKKILFLIIIIFIVSCEAILDKQPLDIISDSIVWDDPVLVNKYLLQCYAEMKFYDEMQLGADHYGYSTSNVTFVATNISDEATAYWFQTPKSHWISINGGHFEWWGYEVVRKLNIFIEQMEASTLPDHEKTNLNAEARFLRAFAYFNMVKRYGGVPLILNVQQLDDPIDELYPKRAKEEEVYQFIINELNEIINAKALPESYTSADLGRPTIYAAAALKSRAAMYAASIATWGQVQLDGIVGIAQSKKDYFWQESLSASEMIINSGKFSLYNKYPENKSKNYRALFLDENNSEVIFSEVFDGRQGKGHSWDHWQNPRGYNSWGGGQASCVYLEMVESYENIDGSDPKIDREKIEGYHLWSMEELFGKKDPRFKASIYTQESSWSHNGEQVKLDYHHGLRLPDGNWIWSGHYEGIPAIGFCQQNPWATPFGVLKYLDESKAMVPDRGYSDTDWIIFRLGEIYLNYAEAAFELNKPDLALSAINEIRNRAGMPLLNSITLEKIRNERKIELAFEGNRYFDLRRWRTAVKDLTNAWHGLRYLLDYSSGKYFLQIVDNVAGNNPVPYFDEKHYYLPITLGRTSANPNLIENPGYK